MPAPLQIIEGLRNVSNGSIPAAIGWHLIFAVAIVLLILGWRPTRRSVGIGIAMLLASVSALAWLYRNPFNGSVFAALTIDAAVAALCHLGTQRVQFPSPAVIFIGALFVAFGWSYPHFLEDGSWYRYLYAAPLGLIPCPTLAAALGLTLIAGLFDCRRWAITLTIVSIGYAVIGVAVLRVEIDLVLLAGAIVLAVATLTPTRQLLPSQHTVAVTQRL